MLKLKSVLQSKIESRGFHGIRDFARSANLNHSTIVKAMNGNSIPKREIVAKWCKALNCTPEEREEIYNAAGYVAPEDEDIKQPAA